MDPVIEEPASEATDVDWRAMQQQAATRWDESVRSVLLEVGRGAWGASRGRSWDIVAMPEEAAWRLFHLLVPDANGGSSFEQLGVRATIDQSGELVAFQVDNGEEFLALADTSASRLRRGLLHLLARDLPRTVSAAPPFAPWEAGGLLARLRAWLRPRT